MKHPICKVWHIPDGNSSRFVMELEDDNWFVWHPDIISWKRAMYLSSTGRWDYLAVKSYPTLNFQQIIDEARAGKHDDRLILTNLKVSK